MLRRQTRLLQCFVFICGQLVLDDFFDFTGVPGFESGYYLVEFYVIGVSPHYTEMSLVTLTLARDPLTKRVIFGQKYVVYRLWTFNFRRHNGLLYTIPLAAVCWRGFIRRRSKAWHSRKAM